MGVKKQDSFAPDSRRCGELLRRADTIGIG